ncbi:hypothetical protein [Borrelia miyamotoi]|uniref:hypothetical protein n=1 Tax=Borrelia miyamotoi TaxID=47466 RepID=UPI001F5B07E9|nr:hypothetical protein [Borrelia miyamotoi]
MEHDLQHLRMQQLYSKQAPPIITIESNTLTEALTAKGIIVPSLIPIKEIKNAIFPNYHSSSSDNLGIIIKAAKPIIAIGATEIVDATIHIICVTGGIIPTPKRNATLLKGPPISIDTITQWY